MNREEYRKAFDELSFSADFQERTADLLRNRARELEKERTNMTFNRTKRIAVLAAACIALLAVSVSAAMLWLTPAQVAEEHNQPLLAEAFEGPDAIEINETVESGDVSQPEEDASQVLSDSIVYSQEELEANTFDMIVSSIVDEDKEKVAEFLTRSETECGGSIGFCVRHKDGEMRTIMCDAEHSEENGELICQWFLLNFT